MAKRFSCFPCMNRNPIKKLKSLCSLLLKILSTSPHISCTCAHIWTKLYGQALLLKCQWDPDMKSFTWSDHHSLWAVLGMAGWRFPTACPSLSALCLEATRGLVAGWDILFLQLPLTSPCSFAWTSVSQFQIQFPQEYKSKRAGNDVFIVLFSDVLLTPGTVPHS